MRVVLVALAVVLAGCPGLTGGSTTTTATPAPVPADVTYPPGVGPDGVVDAERLADIHSDGVDERSYTLVSTRTVRAADGDLRSLLDVTVRLGADRSYHATARTDGTDGPVFLGLPPARGEFWSNGSVYARALDRDGGRTVNRFRPPDDFAASWEYWRSTVAFGGGASYDDETLRSLFASIPTTIDRNDTGNGTVVYRLTGDSARQDDFAKVGAGPVSNVSFAATLTADGIVRGFDLAYEREVDGEPIRVEWTLRYEDVGSTTVDRPDWVERVLDRNGTAANESAAGDEGTAAGTTVTADESNGTAARLDAAPEAVRPPTASSPTRPAAP
jgi:hypothetical protein